MVGWLKDLLILIAMVLGISAVGMGLQAAQGQGDARNPIRTHLESCAECGTAQGHMHCPGMWEIRSSIKRRILEENPWITATGAGNSSSPATADSADPAVSSDLPSPE